MVPAPAATMNHAVASPHLALLPNHNWGIHNHFNGNLSTQKDSTAVAKNEEALDNLAKLGVPREEAQKLETGQMVRSVNRHRLTVK
jgi:hypothetical protein